MQHSEKFIQKRRMLMVLPVLCFPFVTMFFWALGGGQGIAANATPQPSGLNMELPDAYFNSQEKWDKLSIYERATRDSMERDEDLTMDAYFELAALKETKEEDTVKRPKRKQAQPSGTTTYGNAPVFSGNVDPMEEKVNKKIEQLYQQLNAPPVSTANMPLPTTVTPTVSKDEPITSSEIDQLEKLMQSMNEPDAADPEMEQIQNVLEKILDVQHPERVTQRLQQQNTTAVRQRKTYHVGGTIESNGISEFTNDAGDYDYTDSTVFAVALNSNGFYGLEEDETVPVEDNAIPAVVQETQEVVSGATLQLRLTKEVTLNGHIIPEDEYISGICTISGDRLMITINSMRQGNSIYPVALTAYGLDGMQGIPIPGAIGRDVARQSSNQAMQGVQMMSMDPTIEMQAATIGLETAKGFFSKKTQLIKATAKAGQPLLLKDTGTMH